MIVILEVLKLYTPMFFTIMQQMNITYDQIYHLTVLIYPSQTR